MNSEEKNTSDFSPSFINRLTIPVGQSKVGKQKKQAADSGRFEMLL